MSSKQIVNLSDLKADDHNANLGSERGRHQIEASIRKYGFADDNLHSLRERNAPMMELAA